MITTQSRLFVLLALTTSMLAVTRAQQPQSLFDEVGEVRITTTKVPQTRDKWLTLITVTPRDSISGGVEKWLWCLHSDREVVQPQDYRSTGRVLFDKNKVTVVTTTQPAFELNFGGRNAHLVGAWRALHNQPAMSHEDLRKSIVGTFER